jgi:peptide-methionine (S)-S-oxide reductase
MQHTIFFAGGCFWCTEAAMKNVPGVLEVVSGYSGGNHDTATYEEVSAGTTNHAETIKVTWDDAIVDLQKLLQVFFTIHDPTTLNKQGADIGSQYRSVIFYTSDEQRDIVKAWIQKLTDEHVFSDPIVTEVREFKTFYPAEDYHQDFYNKNPNYGYCQVVINPKLSKVAKLLSESK